jgi:chemotaxis protein CheD
MDEAGSVRTDLEAQIFGGAVGGKGFDERLGTRNVEVARRMLTRKGIAVVSEDTGGQRGRKVVFDLATGEVAVFKVRKIRDTDWIFADRGEFVS